MRRGVSWAEELESSFEENIEEDATTSVTDTGTTLGTHEVVRGRRGKWGGIIILGQAPTSHATTPTVEGLEGYGYGGTDPNDNSGILRYVRIWHSGAIIGANNEINGLTLAGARHACV